MNSSKFEPIHIIKDFQKSNKALNSKLKDDDREISKILSFSNLILLNIITKDLYRRKKSFNLNVEVKTEFKIS